MNRTRGPSARVLAFHARHGCQSPLGIQPMGAAGSSRSARDPFEDPSNDGRLRLIDMPLRVTLFAAPGRARRNDAAAIRADVVVAETATAGHVPALRFARHRLMSFLRNR